MKRKIQGVIDLAMTITLPILMAYSLAGEAVHEWLGSIMFMLFILHHVLNWRWHKNLMKGKYSPLRILGTIINTLLCLVMLILPISGMRMAKHTFPFLEMPFSVSSARIIHLLASYWGFILMSLHIGLHSRTLLRKLRGIAINLEQSLPLKIISYVVASLLCIYGIIAFLNRQFPEYLFLTSQFVFIDLSEPLISVLIDYMAIMLMFACVGNYFSFLVQTYGVRGTTLKNKEYLLQGDNEDNQ